MKNQTINRIIAFSAICSMGVLSSCLEDTGYLDIFNGENAGAVVSFGQADHGYVIRTVEVSDAPQSINVGLNVARGATDVAITVAVDATVLADYNAANGTALELLPDSTYTLGSTTVTVPKGELDRPFSFSVISTKISLEHSYVLPLKITSATGGVTVASNLNSAVVSVGVKNEFDGVYSYEGTTMRYQAGDPPYDVTLSGYFGSCTARELSTVTKFSVFFDPLWKDCSGIGGIGNSGAGGPVLAVDPNTVDPNGRYKVTVTAAANPTLRNNPGLENWYDPATRTFKVNFIWGAGGASAPTAGVRTVEAILVYTGPR